MRCRPGPPAAAARPAASPSPAPREVVIDAVQEVKVESGSGETQSGFELTFTLPNRSPLHTLFLLTGGGEHPDPARRHRGHGRRRDDRADATA